MRSNMRRFYKLIKESFLRGRPASRTQTARRLGGGKAMTHRANQKIYRWKEMQSPDPSAGEDIWGKSSIPDGLLFSSKDKCFVCVFISLHCSFLSQTPQRRGGWSFVLFHPFFFQLSAHLIFSCLPLINPDSARNPVWSLHYIYIYFSSAAL